MDIDDLVVEALKKSRDKWRKKYEDDSVKWFKREKEREEYERNALEMSYEIGGKAMKESYLGDGVYIEIIEDRWRVYTSDGAANIWFDVETMTALLKFLGVEPDELHPSNN